MPGTSDGLNLRFIAPAIRRLLALVLVVFLAGCAGRPIGVMKPDSAAASSPGVSLVNMLVATTRAPSKDPGVLFSGERGTGLALSAITVSIPPDAKRTIGQVQWPSKLPSDPQKAFTTVDVKPMLSIPQARAWSREHMPKSRRVMVFVHGFNNRYEDAIYRFAQIVHDSGADVQPVIFTWPSRASIFDYNYDKESTNFSRDALEELLQSLADNPSVGEVTVMAHSMGTWLAMESLRQMAIRDKRVPSKIQNVILAAPDLDVDVFGRQISEIGKQGPKFTIFTSQDDRALLVSRRISGNVDRLGQIDPASEPYRSALEKLGITVIDLTKMKTGDALNHGKFAESPEVVRLIGTRLASGQSVTESGVGLGDALGSVAIGAANTVGQAASVAVSTPIAVFDADTRRNYGGQWRRVTGSVGATVGSFGAPLQVITESN